MKKKWLVEYSHNDGRQGKVNVTTEVEQSGGFQYGNGKAGLLTVGDFAQGYDLRYEKGDLHMAMIKNYFGNGIVSVKEM